MKIDITAPADAAVYVNGVLVTPEYAVSAGEITAEGLGELEEGLADELFTAYHIGGLYAPRRGLRRRGRRQRARL